MLLPLDTRFWCYMDIGTCYMDTAVLYGHRYRIITSYVSSFLVSAAKDN
jgi:hypothetical protein